MVDNRSHTLASVVGSPSVVVVHGKVVMGAAAVDMVVDHRAADVALRKESVEVDMKDFAAV